MKAYKLTDEKRQERANKRQQFIDWAENELSDEDRSKSYAASDAIAAIAASDAIATNIQIDFQAIAKNNKETLTFMWHESCYMI